MINTGSNLIGALLAVILVAGMSAQAYGFGAYRIAADDCCCQSEPVNGNESACDSAETTCCPNENRPSEDSPCSCSCTGCSVMVRTVNLFSPELDLALLFTQDAERLTCVPTRLPASAALGVDIQPPIA